LEALNLAVNKQTNKYDDAVQSSVRVTSSICYKINKIYNPRGDFINLPPQSNAALKSIMPHHIRYFLN